MRRWTVFLSLILAVCIAGICFVCASAAKNGDRVMFTEECVYGDPHAADTLSVSSHVTWSHHLFWDMKQTLGTDPAPITKCSFTAANPYTTYVGEGSHFRMESVIAYGFSVSGVVSGMDDKYTMPGLSAVYSEMYESAKVGEEISRHVRIADYYDYYPLDLSFYLPGTVVSNNDVDLSLPSAEIESILLREKGSERYVTYRFLEYFRIPIIAGEERILTMTKGTGSGVSWGYDYAGDDTYSLYSVSAITDNTCYFTFNTLTNKGVPVDTSLLPDGYGIFAFSYGKGTASHTGIDADSLSMVYPLPLGCTVYDLIYDEQTGKLLLVLGAEDGICLQWIDRDTMECTKEILLRGNGYRFLNCRDGYFVISTDETLAVIDTSAAIPSLSLECDLPADTIGNDLFYFRWDSAFDYDGKRLAIADYLRRDGFYGEQSSYFVAVVSADGLLGCSTYTSSLDSYTSRSFSSAYHVQPNFQKPITVSWKP